MEYTEPYLLYFGSAGIVLSLFYFLFFGMAKTHVSACDLCGKMTSWKELSLGGKAACDVLCEDCWKQEREREKYWQSVK